MEEKKNEHFFAVDKNTPLISRYNFHSYADDVISATPPPPTTLSCRLCRCRLLYIYERKSWKFAEFSKKKENIFAMMKRIQMFMLWRAKQRAMSTTNETKWQKFSFFILFSLKNKREKIATAITSLVFSTICSLWCHLAEWYCGEYWVDNRILISSFSILQFQNYYYNNRAWEEWEGMSALYFNQQIFFNKTFWRTNAVDDDTSHI